MYALTIRQPWAWAICWAGKDVENRSRPDRRIPGKIVAIHAGKAGPLAVDVSGVLAVFRGQGADWMAGCPGLGELCRLAKENRGCIVAVARFGAPVRESASPWFTGPIGWPLSEVRVLPEPIPCRGAQGFWAVPPEIEAAVLAQLEAQPCP